MRSLAGKNSNPSRVSMMPEIIMEANSCLYPGEALKLEWLDADGQGGYASSTVINCHTRKYHGLLVANLQHPPGRYVMLSKFEDSLRLGQEEHFLSCHQYPDLFFPQRGHCLASFRNDPAPRFVYKIGNITLIKTFMLVYGEACLLVRYELENLPSPSLLRLRPFIACRGFHALGVQNRTFNTDSWTLQSGFGIQPYGELPPLIIRTDASSLFLPEPLWYYNFEYSAEKERGYQWREDLFHPGVLEIPVENGKPVIVAASLKRGYLRLTQRWREEEERRVAAATEDASFAERFPEADRDIIMRLLKAARQLLIRTPSGRPAVIAGYHWFDDWGRDTLISLPGLTFCRGRMQDGREILENIGRYEKNGLLPNFFSPDGAAEAYNSVDASLWYFWAVQQMIRYGAGPEETRTNLWPVMKRIISRFLAGTVYDIHTADNGLLHAGNASTHLTWMDAVVNGQPVTPRGGFAVEINALWYNALCFARELGLFFGEKDLFPDDLPARFAASFMETFWIKEGGYLGDVFYQGVLDRSLRPNQIFAVSLPYSPLPGPAAQSVCDKVREHLLTPCGLRTLAPGDVAYRGKYRGDGTQRDAAYHQGTVWPWLLGPFHEACLKTAADGKAAGDEVINHLRAFLKGHLDAAGLGSVSEIFDGDPPHEPNGCISQAWSVGELIRTYSLLAEKVF